MNCEFLLHNELALSVYTAQYPYAWRGSLNVKGGGTGVAREALCRVVPVGLASLRLIALSCLWSEV